MALGRLSATLSRGSRLGRTLVKVGQLIKRACQATCSIRWRRTVVSKTIPVNDGGLVVLTIRLQHPLKAEGITFAGSTVGAKVWSIHFGDDPILTSLTGVDVALFGAASPHTDLLKGHHIKAGCDIVIYGTLPAAGCLTATITGLKPRR